ncbi:hypothetical protein R0U17_004417 [Salmonella enterica]|nr:hypothetical protein [Salmonella enterica]
MQRTTVAKTINAVSLVAMLAVAWQAVRFAMGDIGNVIAPVFELFEQAMRPGIDASASAPELTLFSSVSELATASVKWVFGFVVWLFAAGALMSFGQAAARVATVGWHQYRVEVREAREAARIAHERQTAKARRRELRRKVIEAREPRKSSGFGPFLIGLLLGSFFF